MRILIVDDTEEERRPVEMLLRLEGFEDLLSAVSAKEAFKLLGLDQDPPPKPDVDLILMDLIMPGMNGLEACRLIKSSVHLRDIPIVIITAVGATDSLKAALDRGAVDYITKPVDRLELGARVRSVLRLKAEMDRRKAREKELVELAKQLSDANQMLTRLSFLDALTGISNRRYLDEAFRLEWRRAARDGRPLTLILVDIDYFKKYNDTYGHQAGDLCLKQVASAMIEVLKRPGDFLARYGGEEFAAVLPETDLEGGLKVAEGMRARVTALEIPHSAANNFKQITVSLGVSAVVPNDLLSPEDLLAASDRALYQAKFAGRNQVQVISLSHASNDDDFGSYV